MTKSDFSSVLLFQEGPPPKLGDGVSRPKPTDKTKMFRVEVKIKGSAPMRVVLPAATGSDAVKFAENRWPGAICTLIQA